MTMFTYKYNYTIAKYIGMYAYAHVHMLTDLMSWTPSSARVRMIL